MQKIFFENCFLVDRIFLNDGYFILKFKSDKIRENVSPGQFIMIEIENLILPRAFSVFKVDEKFIWILIKERGRGTSYLKNCDLFKQFMIRGPLGKSIEEYKELFDKDIILVGGGVGIAPLFFIAQKYKDKVKTIYWGLKNTPHPFILKIFKNFPFKISTEDGSFGEKGMILDIFKYKENTNYIICGPLEMIKEFKKKYGEENTWACIEGVMGCGMGYCLGCAFPSKEGRYIRICKDGPCLPLKIIKL